MTQSPQRFMVDRPTVDDLTTTGNDYVPVPFTIEKSNPPATRDHWVTWHLAGIKILQFYAAANNLTVKILGSLDGVEFDETVVAEFIVTSGASAPVTKRIIDYWPYLQVQAKPSVAGQHGTLTTKAVGTTVAAEEANLNAKLPVLSGGKVPVEATVEIIELQPRVLTHVNIDFSSSLEQTIIATPGAGNRIRIVSLELSALVNIEVAIKSGSTIIRTYRGMAVVVDSPISMNLGTNEALKLQATSADRITGGCSYYIEAV